MTSIYLGPKYLILLSLNKPGEVAATSNRGENKCHFESLGCAMNLCGKTQDSLRILAHRTWEWFHGTWMTHAFRFGDLDNPIIIWKSGWILLSNWDDPPSMLVSGQVRRYFTPKISRKPIGKPPEPGGPDLHAPSHDVQELRWFVPTSTSPQKKIGRKVAAMRTKISRSKTHHQ